MTGRELIRELQLLGEVDVPQATLERVWLRVLGECSTVKAGVTATTPLKVPARLGGPLLSPSPQRPPASVGALDGGSHA